MANFIYIALLLGLIYLFSKKVNKSKLNLNFIDFVESKFKTFLSIVGKALPKTFD